MLDQMEATLLMAARAARSITSFSVFLDYANVGYDQQWFHRLIANKCQALVDGSLGKDRLMVFMPPQCGKSEIVSRNFPAWVLGKNPDLKIVGCSYSAVLAAQFSRSIQRIMDSREYSAVFPGTCLNGQAAIGTVKGYLRNVDMFETVGRRGFYKAVGVGGSLTGTPADIAIIDDPVKDAREAYSAVFRDSVWEWYNSVLLTRLHNNSKQLFVMTRWHEDDLAGRILRQEADRWEVVSIPALCEEDADGPLCSPRHLGDSLWEARHSRETLEAAKARVPRVFASLYQQHPVVEGGNIVKREWFCRISMQDFQKKRFQEPVHFYLDTAYSERSVKSDNDPSGILAACLISNEIYLCHAAQVWKEMPDLLRWLPEYMANHWGTRQSILHVEPKANGVSVVQMLKRSTSINVKHTPTPTDSKEVRLSVASPVIECGRVWLVEGDWVEDFLDEVCSFPACKHDEFVDILGYAIDDLAGADNLDYSKIGELNLW